MSYVPGTETGDLPLIAGVVALTIAAVTGWMRLDHRDAGRIIGHCADGTVIGLWKDGLRRRPGRRPEERARVRESYPRSMPRAVLEDDLAPGDLSLVALRPGDEGESPWVIEGLDRERTSLVVVWELDDEREAHEVVERLRERVVRPVRGPRGREIPVGEADLAAARERAAAVSEPPVPGRVIEER